VDTLVTVAGVDVSRDLSHATVYITLLDSGQAGETIKALKHAAGFLRSELAARISLRGVPELRFRYDESPERGARLSALIDDAVRSDQHPEADDDA
jgi:ribosome-binding factor A